VALTTGQLESISAAGRTKKYSYAVDAVKTQLESVFTALFAQLDVGPPLSSFSRSRS